MKLLNIFVGLPPISVVFGVSFPHRRLGSHGEPNPIFYERGADWKQLSSGVSVGNDVTYNSLWAGAVISGKDFVSVTGNVVIGPAASPPGAQAGTTYASTTWVGIDGTGCATQALLQTGVDSYVTNGVTRYEGWWECVMATSATSGYATLENLTTNKVANHTIINAARLCFSSAEWVVEDFYSNGRPSNFMANFTTVKFTEASATTKDGKKHDTSGSEIFGVKHGSKVYTDFINKA
ncbi:concanavalin A-like lectin/glucanase [Thozetella sp. PMI_491]|nr:concanavalin A-like lectin/glucanase [Thozetella sp. PMI_491]